MIKISSVESQNQYGQLLDSRRKRSKAIADLEAWSAQARKFVTPAAAALTDKDVNLLVHRAR